MVIITVGPINAKATLKQTVKDLAKVIQGNFEALTFMHTKKGKMLFLKLGERVNVDEALERLNNKLLKNVKLNAYVPDQVPAFVLKSTSLKPYTIPTKLRRKMNISLDLPDDKLLRIAMDQVLTEMQTKFTGLFDLSKTTGHRLLEEMAQIIYDRLYEIHKSTPAENCFRLTKSYRHKHPHCSDFQFILSVLHPIQDKEGMPRLDLQENQLTAVQVGEFLNMPYEVVLNSCNGHINNISKLLKEHVKKLEVTNTPSSPEEAARMKVRKHLKKMEPYLSAYVRQVIINHLLPSVDSYNVVKIYGEPYLPNKEAMMPFTKQFRPTNAIRSEYMYNHISIKVPWNMYPQLLKADGNYIDNAKLVIRPGKLPMYKIRRVMRHSSMGPSTYEVEDEADHSDEQDQDQDEDHEPMQDMEWSESW